MKHFLSISGLLLAISLTASVAQDVTGIAVPWPPPQAPKDSPFASLTCTSYAVYNKDGVAINPKWGDITPNDFGPRDVKFDYTGIRPMSQVPEPGVHPRIFCTPADLADIRKRIKETRCGQEAWKSLLCYTNMLKGTFDPKADYAQGPVMIRNNNISCRVPVSRCGFRDNATSAALYKALIKGDMTATPGLTWASLSMEAFRCWIEDDTAGGHDLACALTTAMKIDQARRDATRPNKDAPLEQPIAGIHLAYAYDFAYNFLSPDQRKAIHDELANGTWSHDNYGTFNDASNSRSNWATFSYWLIETLSIEGEPGFNDLKVRGMYRGWRNLMTYGWFESGATYEGEAKNQLGLDGMMAFAMRAKAYGFDNLAAHPYARAYALSFIPCSIIPSRDGFIKYDLLGSARSKPLLSDLLGLKYLMPDNKIIDFAYHAAMGDNYENEPNRCEAGAYDTTKWGGYADPLIPYLVYASDFDPTNTDPSKFNVPNTFFCGERALLMTRSSWDKNAMMLNLHVRQANGGHPFCDRNSVFIAGAGRNWTTINGWGINGPDNVNNSEVVIDDHPQADHIPGRMVDFLDNPQATFAVGDASYAWDWNWKFNDATGKTNFYTMDDYKNGKIVVKPGWELEQHSVNDFSYLKRDYPYLTAPLAVQPDWLKVKGMIRPIARQANFPVIKAFRTAGLVRGAHPYSLIVDDIQKDATAHDYTWYMTLEYDMQIAKMTQNGEHGMDILLTGNDPSQTSIPDMGKGQPLPVMRDATAPIPDGQPMLLVRFLNYNNDAKGEIQTEAKTPTILEDLAPADFKGHYTNRCRRLAIPVHTVSPEFKVLIYAFKQGDDIPTTQGDGNKSITISWPGQTDQVDFSTASSGKTDVTVKRGADVLAQVTKPILPLAEPVK